MGMQSRKGNFPGPAAFPDFVGGVGLEGTPLVPASVIRRDFLNTAPISGLAVRSLSQWKPAQFQDRIAEQQRAETGRILKGLNLPKKRVTLMPRMPRLSMPWWT